MSIEAGLILLGFLLTCHFHYQMLDKADLQKRLQRFYATMISKKIFAWVVVTVFYFNDSYCIQPPRIWLLEYLGFTASIFCIDVAQKFAGLKGKAEE